MRSILFAALLAANTGTVMAEQCDINFSGKLQLENRVLSITTQNHDEIIIQPNNLLIVNGQQLALSAQQQRLVSAYYAGIYAAAPQAAHIARDALQIASLTVNEVFTELLGEKNPAVDKLSEKLDHLGLQLHNNFYAQDGEIRLRSADFENGNFVTPEWEQEFEAAIEEVISSSIGQILVSIGTELLFGQGDMTAFEAKMERFGQDIEQRVEYQTSGIEARANALCQGLVQVDKLETQLQRTIPELANLNVLQVSAHRDAM